MDNVNSSKERVSIYIDGSNLYHNLKNYKINTDIINIINIIETKRKIVNIFYYSALLDKSYNEKIFFKHQNFLNKLKKIPNFIIRLCNFKKIVLKDRSIYYTIKGDDIYLAIDLLKGAFENLYDVAIIVSGDEDYIPVIKEVQNYHKKVINAYFPNSSSYKLRKCCNGSINLKKLLLNKRSPNMNKS